MNRKMKAPSTADTKNQILNNNDRMLLILLPVIFIISFFVWQLKANQSAEIVIPPDTPVWDLRDVDMTNHHVRLLGDTSEFVPEAFLTPEEFSQNENMQTGSPASSAEYYTARFRILVPDGKLYAVTFSSIDYADSIYINGTHVQTIGSPGDSADTAIPQTAMAYFTVYPVDGVIEILHQVSNFVHKEYGNPTGLVIGTVESVGQYYDRQTLVTAIVMGACLLLFIVHLVLFALQRRYTANLWFALFCFAWMLRTGVVGVKAIAILFPKISWYVTFRIEYMAIPVAVTLISLALDSMFERLLHKWVKRFIVGLNAAVVMMFLFAPTILMSLALPFVYVATVLTALYVIARFIIKLFRGYGVRQIIILCGLIVFVYLAIREMLYHSDFLIFPITYTGMMDFAALVFVLFQMVAVFHGTMQEVAVAREREQESRIEAESFRRLNDMKTEFLGNISHELKTPLAVISSHAQLTRQHVQEGEPQDGYVVNRMLLISSEAERTAELVEQLLEITRIEEGRLSLNVSDVDINDLVRDMVNKFYPVRNKNHNRIETELSAGECRAACEGYRVTQVLLNLISNAVRFTRNGTITIKTNVDDAEFITILVNDTGSGIPKEQLPYIFDRYHTKII